MILVRPKHIFAIADQMSVQNSRQDHVSCDTRDVETSLLGPLTITWGMPALSLFIGLVLIYRAGMHIELHVMFVNLWCFLVVVPKSCVKSWAQAACSTLDCETSRASLTWNQLLV